LIPVSVSSVMPAVRTAHSAQFMSKRKEGKSWVLLQLTVKRSNLPMKKIF
jgi:hypothetical protein